MPELTHWILTNREVAKRGGREVVVDQRREPLPTFRIAKFSPAGARNAKDGPSLAGRVEVVPDDYVESYADLTPGSDATAEKSSRQLFLALYQEMANAPAEKGDTLFFIHGFNYSWHDALLNLQRLHEVYAVPSSSPVRQIVYFTWPSWGELTRYPSDQRIAAPSGMLLGRAFAKAVRFYADFFRPRDGRPAFCGRKIHLAAHSMGNQVLREFMRSIVGLDYLRVAIFGEVLMLNADVEWNCLEPDQPLFHLHEYSRRTHVYMHSSDDALAISETTKNDGVRRLGRHGPRAISENFDWKTVIDCSDLGGVPRRPSPNDPFLEMAARVLEVDSASARERLFDHWGYLHRREVVADIYQVLGGARSQDIARREKRGDHRYVLLPSTR